MHTKLFPHFPHFHSLAQLNLAQPVIRISSQKNIDTQINCQMTINFRLIIEINATEKKYFQTKQYLPKCAFQQKIQENLT